MSHVYVYSLPYELAGLVFRILIYCPLDLSCKESGYLVSSGAVFSSVSSCVSGFLPCYLVYGYS